MKALLLILALTVTAYAQAEPEWRLIKEMSGEFTGYPGFPVKTYGASVSRGNDLFTISIRFDFPDGVPFELAKGHVPTGFDASSIVRIESRIELNCKTLVVKMRKQSSDVYQFNGKRHKSKETPFQIPPVHVLAAYFCERPSAPSNTPPKLKTK